jgi:hypothetical protein
VVRTVAKEQNYDKSVSDKKHRGRRIKGVRRTYSLDCSELLFVTEIAIAAISAAQPSGYFCKKALLSIRSQ